MQSHELLTSDGISLHLTIFNKSDHPKAIVIFNAATAITQSYYYPLARYLSRKNFCCICWDYRGIGKSAKGSVKGLDYSLHQWGALDFSAVVQYAYSLFPNLKIIVFAHSIGGIIPGFCKDLNLVHGIIGHGVQTAYWKDWKFPQKYQLYLQWHIFLPLITWLFGYFPGRKLGLGTDIPPGYIRHWQMRKRDPDIIRLFTNRYDGNLYFDEYRGKILLTYTEDDPLTTNKAIRKMHELYPFTDISEYAIEPNKYGLNKIGHLEFYQMKNKKNLWHLSEAWIEKILE